VAAAQVNNTSLGAGALQSNTTAIVDANNKIRLGNTAVMVIQGQVAFTASSDKTLPYLKSA
jgi:hypothetical protein